MVVVVGKEEEAGAGVDLECKRDIGELVFRAADGVDAEDEIAAAVTLVAVSWEGAADIQAATDEPIESIAASTFIHEIGIERKDYRDAAGVVVSNKAVTEVQLDGEIVGGKSFESEAVHETDCSPYGIVVGGCVFTGLCKSRSTAKHCYQSNYK